MGRRAFGLAERHFCEWVVERTKGEFHDHPALPDSVVGDFMETQCEREELGCCWTVGHTGRHYQAWNID